MLLFTTGIRRGELLNLTFGDYNRKEATLHIRATKFYKSRLLPINAQIAAEIERYLRARTRKRLPTPPRHSAHLECEGGWSRLYRHRLALLLAATAEEMRNPHAERSATTDSRSSAQLRGECANALVSGRGRRGSEVASAGHLSGSRLGSVDAPLSSLHRADPNSGQRTVRPTLRRADHAPPMRKGQRR